MESAEYVTDAPVATSVHLALSLKKPLLIEGHAGVGKTEVAKVMARMLDTNLIRLQCYEGLDSAATLYEWNYQKQLVQISRDETAHKPVDEEEHEIFSEKFLIKRPLLNAITQDQSPVLLVDEVDRGDEELEAFMLEVFSDWQVTIPEIGTIKATPPPHVVLTSNRTRELSDALRRRCLYLWIDYPSFGKEVRIVELKGPGINHRLATEVTRFMEALRRARPRPCGRHGSGGASPRAPHRLRRPARGDGDLRPLLRVLLARAAGGGGGDPGADRGAARRGDRCLRAAQSRRAEARHPGPGDVGRGGRVRGRRTARRSLSLRP